MMKHFLLASLLLGSAIFVKAGVPDSVYIRPLGNGDGLHLEWSTTGQQWTSVTPDRILSSDYGAWGWGKKMFNPYILKGYNGLYVLVFQPVKDGNVNQFAVATTRDFVHWRPQNYPYMKGLSQCKSPIVLLKNVGYEVLFESEGKYYSTSTTDLAHFTEAKLLDEKASQLYLSAKEKNNVRVAYTALQGIQAAKALAKQHDAQYAEKAKDDAKRFSGITSFEATVKVDGNQTKKISDKLIGIFFEDINYCADGGLYAELIQNRDFEYTNREKKGWNACLSWMAKGDGATLSIDTNNPIHPNNEHYAVLKITDPTRASLVNGGFAGIPIKKGEKYDVSAFLRQQDGKSGKVNVVLRDADKREVIVGRATLSAPTNVWKQQKAVLKATADCKNAVFCIEPTAEGVLNLDFISLFPQNTFRGHKNGLRKDLAETLEALHPQFMRFPGGCVSHGNGLDNIYNWKESIGPLWERKGQPNLWGYHQSRGLGFYEFFQFCEDLNMEPLPVLSAGVPCQNSSWGGNGQQGGIHMDKMPAYIQDILDLIEWANGDAKTTEWGRKRAEAGHPKPFNLHYLGIGNEDLISPTFEERYLMIIKAVKAKYPDITICGTVGPFFEGSDYEEGWRIAAENKIDMVDEHYYCAPGWYLHNQHFYDNYDRSQSKVYLGEYAAHGDGKKSTIETALACALHICSLERNGDVVSFSSYAPLLAKERFTQWNPDLIYFTNNDVHPTVDYYTQMMSGQHAGDTYITSSITPQDNREDVQNRLAVSTVRDSKTGKTYLKLVNLLPSETTVHLSLENLGLTDSKKCTATQLAGSFDSRDARPINTTYEISADGTIQLPAYSFTIIEL